MQRPIKRGESWRIQVRYKELRDSATRDTAQECEQWAAHRLLELKAQYAHHTPTNKKPQYSFKTLFEKYYHEVGRHMRGKSFIYQQLKAFEKYFGALAHESIYNITPQKLTAWRNARLREVAPGTVHRQMCLYSSVFSYAKRELFLINENPFSHVAKPTKPKSRDRLVAPHEVEIILNDLGYVRGTRPETPRQYAAWLFLMALATGMRRGEVHGLRWENVYADYVHLPITKNGESRDVPLSLKARELIDVLPPKQSGKVIPQSLNSFRLIWQRMLHRVGLAGDLRFHDTRHDAVTRFVNDLGLEAAVVAKITGHKDLKTLVHTYYNPSASSIAAMMNKASA